jgi:hypothetical protein
VALYLVSFARKDLWPGIDGESDERIYVDLYEHWLEEAG